MYLKLLEQNIKDGILHLHLPDGKDYHFGSQGMEAHWHLKSEEAIKRIARDPEFELGQTYMEGLWDTGESALSDLLGVLRKNFNLRQFKTWLKPVKSLLDQWNEVSRSYRNIAHHYDTDEKIFRLFLDREMFYSCAYFENPDATLEEAQLAKARHIANKLLIEPGNSVLDIGCGWGSMMFHLAQNHDVKGTGITLSREQLAAASREAQNRSLENVQFELSDYREHQGVYDRIVSIGMFEHVGRPYHGRYFTRIHELLKDDGVALVHTIGRSSPPGYTNAWINKYIFPGGCIPALSEISLAVEKSGLVISDVEVLRVHYARTLEHWLRRFQEHREEIKEMMNEEFCRMWEFYLGVCEVSFDHADLVVFQLQLAKNNRQVPLTRDYLYKDR